MKEVPKRVRKSIVGNLEKSIKKYGYEEVRSIANRYFLHRREKAKLEREVRSKEKELANLRRRL